jgi:hypothetical protein
MEGEKSKSSNILVKLVTIAQTFGWTLIFALTVVLIYYDAVGLEPTGLKVCIYDNLVVFQCLQIVEILFAFLKMAGGSPLFSFLKILGRLLITFGFIHVKLRTSIFFNIIICWSLAEVFRNLYYLTKWRFFGHFR